MKISVGVKIFGVVVVLLILVGSAAWYNALTAESVQSLIVDVHDTYVPAYGSLARANLRSVEEGLFARRMVIAKLQSPDDKDGYARLKQLAAEKSQEADAEFAAARQIIGQEIADPASLENKLELTRLDARLEFLQARHRDYDAVLAALEAALDKGDAAEEKRRLDELDRQRDELNAANRDRPARDAGPARAKPLKWPPTSRHARSDRIDPSGSGPGTGRLDRGVDHRESRASPAPAAPGNRPGAAGRPRHRGARHLPRRGRRAHGRLQFHGEGAALPRRASGRPSGAMSIPASSRG